MATETWQGDTDPGTAPSASGTATDIILVGTYPPTRCGLATFTANTRRSLAELDSARRVDVLQLTDGEGASPAPEVVAAWPRGGSVAAAAQVCNDYDVVLLQHEFGIYDGPEGAAVLDLVDHLAAPLVTVLHTVLVDPSNRQRSIIVNLAARTDQIVVMTETARRCLAGRYDVDVDRVTVIPHGADLNLSDQPTATDIPTILTWGLIGPGKGIEHGIRAVARLAARGVHVRYVVAGETHPNVLRREGERYRDELRQLAARLGIASLVEFDAAYRDFDGLHRLVHSADVVLLPYDSREQMTSGVLVEALAAGKPIVATGFPHACEVVDQRAGLVVPHEEPSAIADALRRLLYDHTLRARCTSAARRQAHRHSWPVVAAAYQSVLDAAQQSVFQV